MRINVNIYAINAIKSVYTALRKVLLFGLGAKEKDISRRKFYWQYTNISANKQRGRFINYVFKSQS